MEFAEHAAFITRLSEQLGGGHVVGCELGVGKVVFTDRLVDVRAQGVAPDKHRGTARGTFRHRPGVAEAQTRLRHRVDGRHVRWCPAAIPEGRHLVDADVIHDHEQDVGRADGGLIRCPGATGQLQRRDDEYDNPQKNSNKHACLRRQFHRTEQISQTMYPRVDPPGQRNGFQAGSCSTVAPLDHRARQQLQAHAIDQQAGAPVEVAEMGQPSRIRTAQCNTAMVSRVGIMACSPQASFPT